MWFADSPMIDGPRLVIKISMRGTSAVVALNKNDGTRLWVSPPLEGNSDYAAIAPSTIDNIRQYVVLTQKSVAGLDPRSGSPLWRAAFPGRTAVASGPVYDDGVLFASCGYGVGCTGYDLKRDGATFSCLELYSNKALASHFGDMVVVDGHVYGCDESSLKCVKLKTGEEVWKNPCEGKGATTYADGHLLVRGLRGGVAWVKATPKGFQLDGRFVPSIRPEARESSWTMPVVSNRRLFLREHDVLLCYDLSKK
jgi:outer membrane protein assembly factor BamB